jgi:transposase-like protein
VPRRTGSPRNRGRARPWKRLVVSEDCHPHCHPSGDPSLSVGRTSRGALIARSRRFRSRHRDRAPPVVSRRSRRVRPACAPGQRSAEPLAPGGAEPASSGAEIAAESAPLVSFWWGGAGLALSRFGGSSAHPAVWQMPPDGILVRGAMSGWRPRGVRADRGAGRADRRRCGGGGRCGDAGGGGCRLPRLWACLGPRLQPVHADAAPSAGLRTAGAGAAGRAALRVSGGFCCRGPGTCIAGPLRQRTGSGTQCVRCVLVATTRDGQTRLGGQRWRCGGCRRRFTARSASAFSGRRRTRLHRLPTQPQRNLGPRPIGGLVATGTETADDRRAGVHRFREGGCAVSGSDLAPVGGGSRR